MAIKRLCLDAGVEKLDAGPKGAVVSFHRDRFAQPEALVQLIQEEAGRLQLKPDHKLVYRRDWASPAERLRGARQFLSGLSRIASS